MHSETCCLFSKSTDEFTQCTKNKECECEKKIYKHLTTREEWLKLWWLTRQRCNTIRRHENEIGEASSMRSTTIMLQDEAGTRTKYGSRGTNDQRVRKWFLMHLFGIYVAIRVSMYVLFSVLCSARVANYGHKISGVIRAEVTHVALSNPISHEYLSTCIITEINGGWWLGLGTNQIKYFLGKPENCRGWTSREHVAEQLC